eukprot:5520125-Pleurochrysis_carterae.AAC.1
MLAMRPLAASPCTIVLSVPMSNLLVPLKPNERARLSTATRRKASISPRCFNALSYVAWRRDAKKNFAN